MVTAEKQNAEMLELLPCPFCSRPAALSVLEEEPGETNSAWVSCECGIELRERATEHAAIAAWNARAAAPPSAGADAVEQVRRKAQRDADFWRSCLGDEKWNPTHDHIEMAISRLQDIANSLSAIQPAPQPHLSRKETRHDENQS